MLKMKNALEDCKLPFEPSLDKSSLITEIECEVLVKYFKIHVVLGILLKEINGATVQHDFILNKLFRN